MEMTYFQPHSHHLNTKIYTQTPILITSQFIQKIQNSQNKFVQLTLTALHLFIQQISSNPKTQQIFDLSFDFHYQLIYQNDYIPQFYTQPLGIRFEDQYYGGRSFYNNESKIIIDWREILQKIVKQRGFFKLYKPIKKIYNQDLCSGYEALRLETKQVVVVQAYSKQISYSKQNGKNKLINEINVLRKIKQQNNFLVQNILQSQSSIYLTFKYFQGESLEKIITKSILHQYDIHKLLTNLWKKYLHFHSLGIVNLQMNLDSIFLSLNSQNIQFLAFPHSHILTQQSQSKTIFIQKDLTRLIEIFQLIIDCLQFQLDYCKQAEQILSNLRQYAQKLVNSQKNQNKITEKQERKISLKCIQQVNQGNNNNDIQELEFKNKQKSTRQSLNSLIRLGSKQGGLSYSLCQLSSNRKSKECLVQSPLLKNSKRSKFKRNNSNQSEGLRLYNI